MERGDDRRTLVNFGSGFVVEIATFLLPDAVVQAPASAAFNGLAEQFEPRKMRQRVAARVATRASTEAKA